VNLPAPDTTRALPEGRVLAVRQSDGLALILRDMMKYSTNVTAEAVGMAASVHGGAASHAASARAMTAWLHARAGLSGARFVDHSGLGPASRIGAGELVQALARLGPGAGLRGLMKEVTFKDKEAPVAPALKVEAKTGTLNFVSTLAGYMTAPGGRDLAFAIFTADVARRDAVSAEDQERPPGGKTWNRQSKRLQSRLIARWGGMFAV
jgi:D-alanyl-D-alanine carboxypeptidase/D-alanyl-D-alanine-endopeptidase (penicillin-binding protein 4)